MFGRKKQARQESPTARPLAQAAQAALGLIFNYGCALVRPPAGLIAQFHRARIAEHSEQRLAISHERDAIADEIRALAAALEPIPDTQDYAENIRSRAGAGRPQRGWN